MTVGEAPTIATVRERSSKARRSNATGPKAVRQAKAAVAGDTIETAARKLRAAAKPVVLLGTNACGEAALEVPNQVVDVFEPDRQPNRIGADPGRAQFVIGQLLMSRRGRMDHETFGVADVREVTPQLERLDERTAGLASPAQTEREDCAGAERKIPRCECAFRAVG